MKRKGLLVIVFAVCLMLSTSGFAIELGVKGGLHMPMGDYGDLVDTGYTIGGQMKMPATDVVSWGVHAGYAMASGDFLGADVDTTLIELYPFVDFYPVRTDRADVFLRGGLGFNMWDIEVDKPGHGSYSDDGTDMMIAAGGGVNFMKNFEAVALYNMVFGDFDDSYFTLTIGYNFDLQR